MAEIIIADSEIDPGKPVKSSIMYRLRDKPTAMFAGTDPDEPRLQSIALTGPVAGEVSIARVYRTYSSPISWTKVGEYTVSRPGTIRTRLYLNCGPSRTAYSRIYVDGVAYGTSRSINNGSQTWDEDLSFSAGDLLQFYVRQDGPDIGPGSDHEFTLLIGNPIDYIYEVL